MIIGAVNILDVNSHFHIVNNTLSGGYAVISLFSSDMTVEYSGNLLLSNNVGSLVAFNSNITFIGRVEFVNNHPNQDITFLIESGGAITLLQSNAYFNGICYLHHNHAENGGGLVSRESKVYVRGSLIIAHNTVTGNGGGVYLSNSELNCQRKSSFILNSNRAEGKGGGLHAISSTIKATSDYLQNAYIGARVHFTKNVAKMGGGLSLEANAMLYILKYKSITLNDEFGVNTTIFTFNSAHYGGAIYVNDDTNSGTCDSNSETECFFQALDVELIQNNRRTQSMHFSKNHANISGSTLYGGLLDRCAVNPFAESDRKYITYSDGVIYFRSFSIPTYKTTNGEEIFVATDISISSGPVKVCLCIKTNQYNCSNQLQALIAVKKGEAFNVSIVTVDQIEQPIDATIHASLESTESGLSEGQMTTKIKGECTTLTFNVVSLHKNETLILYALDGPCKDADLSRKVIKIDFLPCRCPIGFQISGKREMNCTCDCHSNISQYAEHCDSPTGSFIKKSQSRAWISYINEPNLTGYLVYPNCPFDYCSSLPLPINLNQPNGADAQCAFNRSSLLCGSCQPGLSLSLGSSHCLQCPSYWPALLIAITTAAILAGIALVAFLLFFNVTVAVGTLNGLIFYANIVHANKSILFPFRETSVVTVFVSWLNLELGVDTCYIPGMDAYLRTWLQLAFPAYVIVLVALVIVISSYSMRFSNLIGKKDPVATLATLILLSYAKILEICFESLSVGTLSYPDNTQIPLWLPDATVKYLSGKHVPLFNAAILILLVGLIYTALLFSWQWLLCLPDWKIFKWTRDQKLQTFIETHHAPFTPKYRYWTGLLLIAHAILYFVAAANVSNDPHLALSAIIFTVGFILLLRSFLQAKVYKQLSTNILETFFLLNLLFFSLFMWHSFSNTDHIIIRQEAIANVSVLIALIVMLLIILYHAYTYTTIFSILKETRPFRITCAFLTRNDQDARGCHLSLPPDDDTHVLLNVIDHPVNTDDYRVPLLQNKPVEPTRTVIEVHQPYVPPCTRTCKSQDTR